MRTIMVIFLYGLLTIQAFSLLVWAYLGLQWLWRKWEDHQWDKWEKRLGYRLITKDTPKAKPEGDAS